MRHALVIGDDSASISRIETRLSQSGYPSVVHARTEREAWNAIAFRRPGLIVVVAEPGHTPAIDALSRMSRATDAPILVAASQPDKALACIGEGASLDGPFPLDRMDDALRVAAAPMAEAC